MLKNQPHRDRTRLERTRDLMDSNTHDALVTRYESLIPSLQLPDPTTAMFWPPPLHPDEFLCNHLNLAQGLFLQMCSENSQPTKKSALHDERLS